MQILYWQEFIKLIEKSNWYRVLFNTAYLSYLKNDVRAKYIFNCNINPYYYWLMKPAC